MKTSTSHFFLAATLVCFDEMLATRRSAHSSDVLRALFNVPENEAVMADFSLGYRSSELHQPEHRPLEEVARFL